MSDLVTTLLDMLRADAGVQTIFGSPARIFDGETDRSLYPYAELVSAELRDIESARAPGGEHRITIAVNVRGEGREQAAAGLGAIVKAVQENALSLPGQNIALAHPVYLDILRGRQPQTYRGLLRLRIIIEVESSDDG